MISNSGTTSLGLYDFKRQIDAFGGVDYFRPTLVGGYLPNARVMLANGEIVQNVTNGNLTNDPNVDMTGWDFDDNSVSDINKLRLKSAKKGQKVYLISVNEDQNEGGGDFIATQKAGLVDDGGLVIASPNPLLFWVRVNYDSVTPEMFGAKGGNDDDAIALQSSFSHKLPARLSKHYKSSLPIYYTSNKVVKGTGEGSCSITKTTDNTLSLGNRTISGKVMNFDVDAILIAIPNVGDWYAQYNHLDGFTLNRVGVTKTGIGLYAPLICLSSYKNIVIKNSDIGLKSVDSWMVTWERIHSSSNQPFIFGATDTNWTASNTSQTFISCWATDATVWAWNVSSMQYSTFESCGADYIGSDGVPAEGIFKFVYSDVSLISCGSEYLHAYHFLEAEGSRVRLVNYNGQMMYNRYKRPSQTWRTANAMFNVLDGSDVIIEGGRFDFTYNSTHATYGSSCSALAYIEGGSTFIWDDFVRIVADIEDVVSTSSLTWNKFGVYYQNTTGIRVSTRTDVFEIKNTNPAGTSKELLSSTDTHNTFRNFTTTGFVRSNVDNTLESTSLNTIRGFGTLSVRGQATLANGYPVTGLFNLSQVGNIGTGTATHTSQFLLGIDSNKAYFRSGAWGSAFSSWVEFRTTANTTVDANGFIKAASPIIQLFADKIELNDEAQQQEITFEKLGVGDYLIKGSNGFAQEGWYVETPKDANGNVLFSVIYTTLENGDISVKTYQKKFDLETASIVADLSQPVDIAVGRWIDLRLNDANVK